MKKNKLLKITALSLLTIAPTSIALSCSSKPLDISENGIRNRQAWEELKYLKFFWDLDINHIKKQLNWEQNLTPFTLSSELPKQNRDDVNDFFTKIGYPNVTYKTIEENFQSLKSYKEKKEDVKLDDRFKLELDLTHNWVQPAWVFYEEQIVGSEKTWIEKKMWYSDPENLKFRWNLETENDFNLRNAYNRMTEYVISAYGHEYFYKSTFADSLNKDYISWNGEGKKPVNEQNFLYKIINKWFVNYNSYAWSHSVKVKTENNSITYTLSINLASNPIEIDFTYPA